MLGNANLCWGMQEMQEQPLALFFLASVSTSVGTVQRTRGHGDQESKLWACIPAPYKHDLGEAISPLSMSVVISTSELVFLVVDIHIQQSVWTTLGAIKSPSPSFFLESAKHLNPIADTETISFTSDQLALERN